MVKDCDYMFNDAAVHYHTRTAIFWSPDTNVFLLRIHFLDTMM